jgi:hypothetical protein
VGPAPDPPLPGLAAGQRADAVPAGPAGGDLAAIWRRPKLIARGDPDHDHVVAGTVARLLDLRRQAVVLAEDETHLNLLPHVRASWTPRAARPTTGQWVYRLGRRCAADFIALLDQVSAVTGWAHLSGSIPFQAGTLTCR